MPPILTPKHPLITWETNINWLNKLMGSLHYFEPNKPNPNPKVTVSFDGSITPILFVSMN